MTTFRRSHAVEILARAGLGLILAALLFHPALAATTVSLVWDQNPEADVAGYRLRWGTTPGDHTLGTLDVPGKTSTTSIVQGLTAGVTHYFAVHAYDLAGNESAASNEVSAVPVVTVGPVLTVSGDDFPDPVAAGGTITYTLAYGNTGDEDATGVVLRDTLPSSTTFVSATQGGTNSSGTVTWNPGTVARGASGSVALTVRVASPLANGTIISNGTFSIDSNETTAVAGTAITTAVTSSPSLSITMTDAPDPVAAGGTITYTLNYANGGNANTSTVVITDPLPANTSFVSATGGGTFAGGVVTWNVGTLNAGTTGSRQVTVRVDSPLIAGTVITNSGYAIDSSETTPASGSPVTTTVQAAPAPTITANAVEMKSTSMYVVQGETQTIKIAGTNFQAGATVGLGAGITTGAASVLGSTEITVPITVGGTAALGLRTLTVANPDGQSASRTQALQVVRSPDMNGDCLVNSIDLNILAISYGSTSGGAKYNASADLNGDAIIDGRDLTILYEYMGQRMTACP